MSDFGDGEETGPSFCFDRGIYRKKSVVPLYSRFLDLQEVILCQTLETVKRQAPLFCFDRGDIQKKCCPPLFEVFGSTG